MEKQLIVKHVRNKVENTLDILQNADRTRFKSSWKEELDGEETHEELSVSSNDASLDSFLYEGKKPEESSEDSCIEKSKTFKELEINSDIVLIVPEDEYRYLSSDIQCARWTAEDRKKTQIPLTEDDLEVTDIYRTTGFTATDISVEVKVNLPKTHIPLHVVFEYFLLVETDDQNWHTLPSKLVTSNNTSLTKLPDNIKISSICAVARRISEKFTVTEDGYEFISSLDTRLKLDFPKGAVDHNTDIQIQILPIDHERVRELKEYNPRLFNTILNMSDVVSVKYEHTKDFNKKVKLQLPLSLTTPNNDDYEPLFIRWNGNQPEILNDILSETEPGIYSTAVSHFSDAAVVLAHKHASPEDTLYATEILSGKSEACNILTFYKFGILGRQPSLWVELVLSKNKDETRKKRQAEGLTELPYSYSPDMHIKNQERVRVGLKLNIEFPPGICKGTCYLKFDKFCLSNHLTFLILQKSRMGSPHYVAIEYKFSKSKEIHSIHFDPVTMKKNLLLPTKNQAQESWTRPSDDRKRNMGFGMERNGHRIAWSEQSSLNTRRTNQGQSQYSETNRQKTILPSIISLPQPQLARSIQSSQNTRRANQVQTHVESNSLPQSQLARSIQSSQNTRRANQVQTYGESNSLPQSQLARSIQSSQNTRRANQVQTHGESNSLPQSQLARSIQSSQNTRRANQVQTHGESNTLPQSQLDESIQPSQNTRRANQVQTHGESNSLPQPQLARSIQSSQNTRRANQVQVHGESNLIYMLPHPPQLVRSIQSPQITRRTNQVQAHGESNLLHRQMSNISLLPTLEQSFQNTRRANQVQAHGESNLLYRLPHPPQLVRSIQSSQITRRTNQVQAHGESNLLHRQMSNISLLPTLELSFQNTRRANQVQALGESNLLHRQMSNISLLQ